MALRKGMELLQQEGTTGLKAMEFFIDHATGKAKEKAANSLMDEDDDMGSDIEEVNRMMEKLERLKDGENSSEVQKSDVVSDVVSEGNDSDRDI